MKKLLLTVAAVFATAVIIILAAGKGSVYLTDHLNRKYRALYLDNATGVSTPWYDEGYHIVDERFIKEMEAMKEDGRKVISIGSSVSSIPFQDDIAADSDLSYRFMSSGNGCYKTDEIMYRLLQTEQLIREDDIIKLEVSFSTYREPSMTITETALDKWGKYKIVYDDPQDVYSDFSVKKSPSYLAPLYLFNASLIRIQNVYELVTDYADQLLHGNRGEGLTERAAEFGIEQNGSWDDIIIPGNYRNNYYNPEAVEETLLISDEIEDKLEELITKMQGRHRLIIELSPTPPNIADTAFGREYERNLQERLIPYLESNNIIYLDYRNDYKQNEYSDGVHLGYEAGCRYTKRVMEDIEKYEKETEGKS